MQLEIKTTIDAFNPNQVKALNDFLTAIGGHRDECCKAGGILLEEKPKATRKKAEKETFATTETLKESIAPGAEQPQQVTEEVKVIEVVEPETVRVPTLMQIRSLVAQKAGEHKDAIKAKLVELGAQNVSTLDAKHFQTIFDFLSAL